MKKDLENRLVNFSSGIISLANNLKNENLIELVLEFCERHIRIVKHWQESSHANTNLRMFITNQIESGNLNNGTE